MEIEVLYLVCVLSFFFHSCICLRGAYIKKLLLLFIKVFYIKDQISSAEQLPVWS